MTAFGGKERAITTSCDLRWRFSVFAQGFNFRILIIASVKLHDFNDEVKGDERTQDRDAYPPPGGSSLLHQGKPHREASAPMKRLEC